MSTTKDPGKSTLERAIELAESGECATTADIQVRLKEEGHTNVDSVLGPWLLRELRQILDERPKRGLMRFLDHGHR